MDDRKKYPVLTLCPTYNQADCIVDAMNGFAMQQTDFPVVTVIMDDASTDGNDAVIREYLQTNFDQQEQDLAYDKDLDYGRVSFARHKTNKNCFFFVVCLKENLYGRDDIKQSYIKEWMDGAKYVAFCEGDDYWTDPNKLQEQVGYLETHPDSCMCTHATDWDEKGDIRLKGCRHETECDISTDEVIRKGGLYIASCSLVFRIQLMNDWPAWRKQADIWDFPIKILGTLRGKLHYFPKRMGVYRYRREGSWTDKHQIFRLDYVQNKMAWLDRLNEETNGKHADAIYAHSYRWYRFLFVKKKISWSEYLSYCRKSKDITKGQVCLGIIKKSLDPCFHFQW